MRPSAELTDLPTINSPQPLHRPLLTNAVLWAFGGRADGGGEIWPGGAIRLFDSVGKAAKLSLEGMMGEERPLCTAGSRIDGGANELDSAKAGKSAGSVRADLFKIVGEISRGEAGSSILDWAFTTNRKSCMNML